MKKVYTLFLGLFVLCSAYSQNPTHILFDVWSDDNWLYMGELRFTYTDNDSLDNRSLYSLDINDSELIHSFQENYTYNSSGLLSESISSMKIEGEDTWIDYQKRNYEYDENNRLVTETLEEFTTNDNDGFVWTAFDRKFYEYNTLGLKVKEIRQIWDPFLSWINERQTTYSYNELQLLESELVKAMYEDDTTTTDMFLIEYSYSDDHLLKKIERNESVLGVWVPKEKEIFLYNPENFLTQTIYSYWNANEQAYIFSGQDSFTYNENNLLSTKISENYFDGIWVKYRRYLYIYPAPTSTRKEKEHFPLYPNPASSTITIRFNENSEKTVEILDLCGRVLYSNRTHDSHLTIPVNGLPNQMYLLRIQQNNQIQVQKWIKH